MLYAVNDEAIEPGVRPSILLKDSLMSRHFNFTFLAS